MYNLFSLFSADSDVMIPTFFESQSNTIIVFTPQQNPVPSFMIVNRNGP